MPAEPNRSNHSELLDPSARADPHVAADHEERPEVDPSARADALSGFQDHERRAPLRERLEGWAESLDLTLPRLTAGAAVMAVLGLVGWRLLDTPSEPPEMALPMTSGSEQDASSGSSGAGSPAVDGSGEAEPSPSTDGSGAAGASAASPSEVVVHVAGAVREPGVQRLDPAARVVDAVEAAGGATEDADPARVNLAAPLEDGQQVYLPRAGEDPPERVTVPGDATADSSNGSAGHLESGSPGGLVNVNTAGTRALETLHGIGPALAQAIVDHRDEHGPFTSVEQLTDVRGIGQAKLDGVRDQVTV